MWLLIMCGMSALLALLEHTFCVAALNFAVKLRSGNASKKKTISGASIQRLLASPTQLFKENLVTLLYKKLCNFYKKRSNFKRILVTLKAS